eukprot:scaffold561_cov254-Pinguiococcus_pyrenoidosus.AAC.3
MGLKGQAKRAQQQSERYKEVISRTQTEISHANEEIAQLRAELGTRRDAEMALKQELERAAQGVQDELRQAEAEKRVRLPDKVRAPGAADCVPQARQILIGSVCVAKLGGRADARALSPGHRRWPSHRYQGARSARFEKRSMPPGAANIERLQKENADLKASHLEFQSELERQVQENHALRQRVRRSKHWLGLPTYKSTNTDGSSDHENVNAACSSRPTSGRWRTIRRDLLPCNPYWKLREPRVCRGRYNYAPRPHSLKNLS